MAFDKVNEQFILDQLDLLKKDQGYEQYYEDSYGPMLDYFIDIRTEINASKLIAGITMVYGWMPRIPKNVNIKLLESHIHLFVKAYNEVLESSELNLIQKCVNGSMIGASKVLHFINPQQYPIWDTNVGYACELHSYGKVNNYKAYQAYCDKMTDLEATINKQQLDTKLESLNIKSNANLSRTIELSLFLIGRNMKKK